MEYLRFLSLDLRKISLPHRLEIIRSDYEFFLGKYLLLMRGLVDFVISKA